VPEAQQRPHQPQPQVQQNRLHRWVVLVEQALVEPVAADTSPSSKQSDDIINNKRKKRNPFQTDRSLQKGLLFLMIKAI
jgi:hypothetical protein